MASGDAPLTALLDRADLWRGRRRSRSRSDTGQLPTGFPELDQALGGGWPLGALTECLVPDAGVGELQLLLPALARLSGQGRWLAWVAPPWQPYPPALAQAGIDLRRTLLIRPDNATDRLWAMEQCLRSGVCGALLGWPEPHQINPAMSRRLQLAAQEGACWGVLFLPAAAPAGHATAALRLRVTAGPGQTLRVTLLRQRGSWARGDLYLSRPDTPHDTPGLSATA